MMILKLNFLSNQLVQILTFYDSINNIDSLYLLYKKWNYFVSMQNRDPIRFINVEASVYKP